MGYRASELGALTHRGQRARGIAPRRRPRVLAETFQARPIHHAQSLGYVERDFVTPRAKKYSQLRSRTAASSRKLIHLPVNPVGINELSGKRHAVLLVKPQTGSMQSTCPAPRNLPVTQSERNALSLKATSRYTFCYRTETERRLTTRAGRYHERDASRGAAPPVTA